MGRRVGAVQTCALLMIGLLSLGVSPPTLATGPAESAPLQPLSELLDVTVALDERAASGAPLSLMVATSTSAKLGHSRPVSAEVEVRLVREERVIVLARNTSNQDGELQINVALPDEDLKTVTLEIAARYGQHERIVRQPLSVGTRRDLFLRTDRALYAPGQVVHWRAAVLEAIHLRPSKGRSVRVALKGPGDTLLEAGSHTSGPGGWASGTFRLDERARAGSYTVEASLGSVSKKLTLDVRHFEPPPFEVSVALKRAAESAPVAHVLARHFYGEPVAGEVVAEAGGTKVRGTLDSSGRAQLELPRSATAVKVTVADPAGRRASASDTLPPPEGPFDLAVNSWSASVVAGGEWRLSALTTRDGSPAPAKVEAHLVIDGVAGPAQHLQSNGVAELAFEVPASVSSPKHETHTTVTSKTIFGRDEATTEAIDASVAAFADATAACASEDRRYDIVLTHTTRHDRSAVTRRPFGVGDGFVATVERQEATCVLAAARRHLPPLSGSDRVEVGVRHTRQVVNAPTEDFKVGAVVTAIGHDGIRKSRSLSVATRAPRNVAEAVIIADPVVEAGGIVEARVRWPTPQRPVIGSALSAQLLKDGIPVASAPVTATADGQLHAAITAPNGVHGLVEVRFAGRRWWDNGSARSLSARASAFIQQPKLQLDLSAPARIKPGATFSVTAELTSQGEPIPGAALAVSAVDTRVLSMRPRQAPISTLIDKQDTRSIRSQGALFSRLLKKPTLSAAERGLMATIVRSLRSARTEPRWHATALDRTQHETVTRRRALVSARDALASRDDAVVSVDSGHPLRPLSDELEALGWPADQRVDAWRRPRTWSSVGLYEAGPLGAYVDSVRLARSLDTVWQQRKRWRALLRAGNVSGDKLVDVPLDAWGRPFIIVDGNPPQLVATGQDGTLGGDDDQKISLSAQSVRGYGSGSGIGAIGMGGAGGGGHLLGRRGRSAKLLMASHAAVRRNFDETVLWQVGETTDASGRLTTRATAPDSVAALEVEVEALSPTGGVGRATTTVQTFLETHASATLPAQLTLDDRYDVRVAVTYHGDAAAPRRFQVDAAARDGLSIDGPDDVEVVVAPGSTAAGFVRVVADGVGTGVLRLTVIDLEDDRVVDIVERTIDVLPEGPEVRWVNTSVVTATGAVLHPPEAHNADPASFRGKLRVFRGAPDQALDTLDQLVREPHGCFEQTSSATFPNLLVMQLLDGKAGTDEVVSKARTLVMKGYQRLTNYEVPGGGFSWWGNAPAMNVLTAYGLVEFVEMSKVIDVDQALIARTRRFIEGLQKPDGSFPIDQQWKEYQSVGAVTAYVVWALARAGGSDDVLRRGLKFLRRNASIRDDAYALALWASAELRAPRGKPAKALAALERFEKSDADGRHLKPGKRNLFFEGGTAAATEATAILAEALTNAGRDGSRNRERLAWLWSARQPQWGWGTTQATVQALLAAASAERVSPAARNGRLHVAQGDGPRATFDLASSDIPTVDLAASSAGRAVRVTGDFEGQLQAEVRGSYYRRTAKAPRDEGLRVRAMPKDAKLTLGETATLVVGVDNPTDVAVAMPTVTVPLAPGFEVTDAALRAVTSKESRITRAERHGSEVHLYLDKLKPSEDVVVELSLTATATGVLTQRAAVGYAYYDPAVRGTSAAATWRVTRPGPVVSAAP